MMKEFLFSIAIIHIIFVVLTLMVGITELIINASYGKDDEDFQCGLLLIRYCFFPALAIYKTIMFVVSDID